MILKLALLMTDLFLGVGIMATVTPAPTDKVVVQTVDSLDEVSAANYDDSYLGMIFYQPVDESKIIHVNNTGLRISEINNVEEADVNGKLLGKYFYQIEEGVVGEGYLIGTEFTTNKYLNEMVENTKKEINSGNIKHDYQNINERSTVSMTIGDSWASIISRKLTWSLDYDGVHYGDFAEWYSTFRIYTNNYRYYLIAHETYIAPNNDNTDDFRTSKLIYKFNPNSDQVELRDYQPKAKNPEMTISYGSDLSAEISSDGSAKVGASVSSSYSTILESPKVYDKGNMANDEVNIEFEYVDPWGEDSTFLPYNINQSMQTAIYIIRENRSNTALIDMSDVRTIQMVRDDFWFWNDRTVNFNYNITYTI